ncbi:aromatic-L-amino-acid decarboxylase-like, partial [Ceratina calcarata]|uniref:Aromatic-L-amino-acid decarboxylase-like n=1 Tax=Ceratina calcarata TaxID=156304 RepID=A0AAJ7ISM1_9HYME
MRIIFLSSNNIISVFNPRLKDSRKLVQAFSVDRIYLDHDKQGLVPDYRHWQIPLGRRFRAMKLWFVLRLYGVEGLQKHIRHTIKLAQFFESYIKSDSRFEIVTDSMMGLICFRMKVYAIYGNI